MPAKKSETTQPTQDKVDAKTTTESASEKKSLWRSVLGSKIFRYIVVPIVALAILGGTWAYFGTQDAAKVSNEFLEDVTAGRFDEAYSVVSEDFRDAFTEEQFEQALANLPDAELDIGKLKSREIEKTSEGQRATLVYDATAKDGEYELEVILVEENGEWRVYNFESTKK